MDKRILLVVSVVMVLSTSIIFAGGLIGIPTMSSLYYSRNPLDIMFRPNILDIEAFYIPEGAEWSYQGIAGTLRISIGPLSIGGSALYSGYNLIEYLSYGADPLSIGSINFMAGGGVNLGPIVFAAYMPIPLNITTGSMDLSGTKLLTAFGIGKATTGWKYRNYQVVRYKKGGGAIYYINRGIAGFDEEGNFVVNPEIDWLDGAIGIYSVSKVKDSFAVLDIRFDTNFFKNLEEEENPGGNILDYIFATLQFSSDSLILGATYNYNHSLSFDGGLEIFGLKGWIEAKFDMNFNMLGWGAYLQLSL